MPPRNDLPHLVVPGAPNAHGYTSIGSRGEELPLPQRNVRAHGNALKRQLELIQRQIEAREGVNTDLGVVIAVESSPNFPLNLKSLERHDSGITVLSAHKVPVPTARGANVEKTVASVFIPHGKLSVFFSVVEAYLTKTNPKSGEPRNKKLVDTINALKIATLESLWTDTIPFPVFDEPYRWEVWLREGSASAPSEGVEAAFREEAVRLGLECSERSIVFPERTVLLVRGAPRQMHESIRLLNCMAELHGAKETADFFIGLPRDEERQWVEDAVRRLQPARRDGPAVCLLDVGVNRAHPLVAPFLSPEDTQSHNPAWGAQDDTGHGTEMAGLALFGDLTPVLESRGPIVTPHLLESVKILPPRGQNPPELYGDITKACIARAEVQAPRRARAICLTATTRDGRDRGQPSSWSAALDQASSGAGEEGTPKRLILASAGNTAIEQRREYPASNQTEGVHDPGQSWNALTIGAFTEKVTLPEPLQDEWTPLAPTGALAPSSSTSLVWTPAPWPYKPDIVFEGGNMARNRNDQGRIEDQESLALLTTNWRPEERLLYTTGETSAATSLASRLGAMIMARYPRLWPETVRALLVHSARWKAGMLGGLNDLWGRPKNEIEAVLRTVGFGVPDPTLAMTSSSSSLTLIAQSELEPFRKIENRIKTKDFHLHRLPWPIAELRRLTRDVTMRVTLSYFIEPSPSRRNVPPKFADTSKFRYPSCGLRFDVKGATETEQHFRQRINRIDRDEAMDYEAGGADADEWLLGPKLRTRGSIHSDAWKGTGAALADKGSIVVMPVRGWWSERPHLNRWNSKIRYSLIVSIETEEQEIDIYTPVETMVAIATRT